MAVRFPHIYCNLVYQLLFILRDRKLDYKNYRRIVYNFSYCTIKTKAKVLLITFTEEHYICTCSLDSLATVRSPQY